MNDKRKQVFTRYLFILIFCSFLISGLEAQLSDLIMQANEQFSPIETDKEIITQELIMDPDQYYNVTLTRSTEKIKDGKIKTEQFLFNLALLNEKKVTIKSSKNKMLVKMETKGGKYIQRYEDDESKGYTNVIEMQFVDIDEARDAKTTWEALIPAAKTAWTQAINLPQSLGDLKSWLQPYVVDVDMGKHIASQSLTENTMYEDYVSYEVSNLNGKEKREIYRFSLSDIDNESIKVRPSGSVMIMDLGTEGSQKLILKEDEDGTTFHNNLSIYFTDAGSALEMSKGMEVVTAMAQLSADERNKSYKNCDNCLGSFTAFINSYTAEKINTTIEGDCASTMKISNGNSDEVYEFRWADLDPKRIKQDYNTNELKLTIETVGKKKYVTKRVDGEIKGYNNKVEFLFHDLETFRQGGAQAINIIEGCEVGLEPESITWLDELFSGQSFEKMEQSISIEEECSVVYTSSQKDGEKSDTYEFNLYDLDPKRTNVKISRSKLQLELSTNNKEKIITKTNEDGKLEYTNKLTLSFETLDALRKAEMTFIEQINGCEQG
jgi:hypothetical protein